MMKRASSNQPGVEGGFGIFASGAALAVKNLGIFCVGSAWHKLRMS